MVICTPTQLKTAARKGKTKSTPPRPPIPSRPRFFPGLEAHAVLGQDAAGVTAVGRVVDVRVPAADEGAGAAAGGGLGDGVGEEGYGRMDRWLRDGRGLEEAPRQDS